MQIINGRPDFGERARPRARIVGLRAQHEEGRAIHKQRVVSVLSDNLRHRVIGALARHLTAEKDKAKTGQGCGAKPAA